jgi:hypothetical protein
MQFFFRTGKNMGVGVSPIGALFVATIYAVVLIAGVALIVAYVAGLLLVACGRRALELTRGRRR